MTNYGNPLQYACYVGLMILALVGIMGLGGCRPDAETGNPSGATDTTSTAEVDGGLLKDGEMEETYANGQVRSVIRYKSGRPWDAVSAFDSTGQSLDPGSLKAGHGTLLVYRPDGTLLARHTYRAGLLHGPTALFDSTEAQYAALQYADGVLESANTSDSLLVGSRGAGEVSAAGAFDQQVTDQLMRAVQKNDLDYFYRHLVTEYKEQVSFNNFRKYFDYTRELYGPIQKYALDTYNFTKQARLGEGVQVMYVCQFSYCRGAVQMTLFREQGHFRVMDFTIQTEPYTPFTQLKDIGDPLMEALKAGNLDKLYAQTSDRFQAKTPRAEFDAMVKRFQQAGSINHYQLYQHQVGLDGRALLLVLIYELEIAGKETYIEVALRQNQQNQFEVEALRQVK